MIPTSLTVNYSVPFTLCWRRLIPASFLLRNQATLPPPPPQKKKKKKKRKKSFPLKGIKYDWSCCVFLVAGSQKSTKQRGQKYISWELLQWRKVRFLCLLTFSNFFYQNLYTVCDLALGLILNKVAVWLCNLLVPRRSLFSFSVLSVSHCVAYFWRPVSMAFT